MRRLRERRWRGCLLTFKSVALGDQALLAGADASVARRAFDRAAIAACAESVGAMQAMLAATVGCTRTRQQFGKPRWRSIRSFAIGWPTCQWPATKPDR